MKKFKFWALAIAGVVALNACKDDDNVVPQAFVMQLNQPAGGNTSLAANAEMPVSISMMSNNGLINLSATATYDDSTFTLFSTVLDTLLEFDYVDTLVIPFTSDDVVYEFIAMDADSATVSRTINVNVIAEFGDAQDGQVWNIQGPNTGAWDFMGDSAVAAAGDSLVKDIIDNTTGGLGVTYDAEWVSGNGTTFVIDNNLTFAANLGQIVAAYEAGTELENTGTLEAGDIVVCKNARFPQGYVLVEVTNVDDTSIINNLDNVTFMYKK